MALHALVLEGPEHVGLEVQAVEEDEGVVGDLVPHRLRVAAFVGGIRAEVGGEQKMRAQCDDGHQSQRRIAARSPAAGALAGEVLAIVGTVGDAQGGAVDAPQGQPAPAISAGGGARPSGGTAAKQPLERCGAEARAGLRHRARSDAAGTTGHWQRQIEVTHDLDNRAVADQRHAEDEPDHLFCGKPAAAQGGCAGGEQGLLDPVRIEVVSEGRKARGGDFGGVGERLGQAGFERVHDRPSMILCRRGFHSRRKRCALPRAPGQVASISRRAGSGRLLGLGG